MRRTVGLCMAVLTIACGDGTTDPPRPDPPRATTVTVTPATTELTALGATVQLTAEVRDQNGQAMAGATVSWASSEAGVATVASSGLVTAAGNGAATITATAGSASGSAAVAVAQAVATIAVSPPADTLVAFGDTVRLTAEATDANGHVVTGSDFEWQSSDTLVARVDETGLVESAAEGAVEVTATASGVMGRAELSVVPPLPTTVAMSADTLRFTALGETAQLAVEVREQAGRVMAEVLVSWASGDTLVAVVDSAGLVKAVGGGTTTVSATAGEASGAVVVTVMQSAGSVVVTPASGAVALGDTLRLTAEAFDENGHLIDGAAFSWSSGDVSVATVDASGLVSGAAEGTVTVSATADDASGTAEITVENPDRAVLVTLYEAMDGPNWHSSDNWLTDAPLADWYAVGVDRNGRVESLGFWANNLKGEIPPEVGRLSALSYLDFNSNLVSGSIPPELGRLSNLKDLNISSNRLTGSIPEELGALSDLTQLRLARNGLTGPIPRSLLALQRLRDLRIADNPGLCAPGTAPFAAWLNGIGERDEVAYCNASDRAMLEALYEAADGPAWTRSEGWPKGPVLAEWHGVRADSLGRVVALDLTRNALAGQLPNRLGELTRMTELRLSGNPGLSGPVPLSLARLSLRTLHYADTGMCTPASDYFRRWLNGIKIHEGTGVECVPQSAHGVLSVLFRATDGPNWRHSVNWLTDAPLGDWHGVEVDGEGRVTGVALPANNLAGPIPPELGDLAHLTTLDLSNNALSGPIPAELGNLANLARVNLGDNNLSGSTPPELGRLARLEHLDLRHNFLLGSIPPEFGSLSRLDVLILEYNKLSGPIPPQLGELARLRTMSLIGNRLSGPIPPELGGLANLRSLRLADNALTGPIPPDLGDLSRLDGLFLDNNSLSGPIPPELGGLASLRDLVLGVNSLTGRIPSELGGLSRLTRLDISYNSLAGPLPPELGELSTLERLRLGHNRLEGSVPARFAELTSLRELSLVNNPNLSGALPTGLTALRRLEALLAGGTELCAPPEPGFTDWLERVPNRWVARCEGELPTAYLVQAVQSREFPVPLVAGREALLRVFPTATRTTGEGIPPVRARFYVDGRETHVALTPATSVPIPTEVDEGDLSKSANTVIPAQVVQPGLEMVVEVDPDGTLDPGLGVTRRIPATGRMPLDVQTMPHFHLTVVPLLWRTAPDSSVLERTRGMTADDELFWMTRTILPIGDFEVAVHEPVLISSNQSGSIIREMELIWAVEGRRGHYQGLITGNIGGSLGGLASRRTRRATYVLIGGGERFGHGVEWDAHVAAHELGHNMSLEHTLRSQGAADPSYPYADGSIGAWGYDFRAGGSLVEATTPDVMGYTNPAAWVSDYHFTNALRFRLTDEADAVGTPAAVRSLLLWGGTDSDGVPFLDPAFVVDAPPALPESGGEYEITGRTDSGDELFSLRFEMTDAVHGDEESSFIFALPVEPGWAERIESITLSGPGGSDTLDWKSNRPVAILRDPLTGQVRAILRDPPIAASADGAVAADAASLAGQDVEVLFSRGIPDSRESRR